MTEPINNEFDPMPCFKDLRPATQQFIVRWALSPLTVQELLEDEEEREVIIREIKEYDVLLLE